MINTATLNSCFFWFLTYTIDTQKENKIMPRDEQIHIRLSSKKKDRIKKRADSLDKSVSEHMLSCYDLEESISRGDSIVIPRSKQVSPEGKSAT